MDHNDMIYDIREESFDNIIREHIIFLILFLILYFGSYVVIGKFRRRDHEDLYSGEEDEILVYRISMWLCTCSLAVAAGASLLLPVSIASNEVLLLYPKSYYVKWLNSSLIHGLWNHMFIFSNLCIFVFLPFAYLFSESTGFVGYKKGVVSRAFETITVFAFLSISVLGLTYVIYAAVYPCSGFPAIFHYSYNHLSILYSFVSFVGVLMMIVCTPLGFVRLFSVVNRVLAKPHLKRSIYEEYNKFNLEEMCIKRKLNANIKVLRNVCIIRNKFSTTHNSEICKMCKSKMSSSHFNVCLLHRLKDLQNKRNMLDKLRTSNALQRNIVYPLAMLLLIFLTSLTVLIVLQNTLELLIGMKALQINTRKFTLGIASLSKMGSIGAGLEVFVIFYLGTTSSIGLYTMPFMRFVRPKRRQTSLSQIIFNCAILLILSSAQPLLSRIIGITNFDLIGEYGSIKWLGNFHIVFMYNLIFGTLTTFCLIKKFTATVRKELCSRLVENYMLLLSYMKFIY